MEAMNYLKSLFPSIYTDQGSKSRVLIILLIALVVRSIGIASRPIWYDEAFAILFSEKGLGQMLYGTLTPTGAGSADIHPLGYYTLLWVWMEIFGESLIATRMLSILAGLAVIYLVYKISFELFDANTAGVAALIVALSPFQVHYAQEIRMYALLALWLLLATFSYLRGSKSGNWHWWVVFGIAAALAQYTHNLAVIFLIPLAATPILKKDWENLRLVFFSGCVAILLYLPWLIQLPAQFAKVSSSYWVTKPDISSLFTLLLVFTTNTPLPKGWILPALTLAILIVVIATKQTLYATSGDGKANGLWTLYLTIAPLFLLFTFSQWIPVYIERVLLPSGAIFCILLAWVIQHTKMSNTGRNLLIGLLTVAYTAGIYQHVTYRGFPYGPFREMTSFLHNQVKQGDLIVHSNKLTLLPAMYFDRELAQSFVSDPPGSATDTLAPATQQVLEIEAETDIGTAVSGAERVWYIIYQRSIDEYIQAGKSTHPDIEYLNSELTLESQKTWDDLRILLYTKKP
jgi:mannosyltransferase